MASKQKHQNEECSFNDVRKENFRLVKDIVRYCSHRDYKKHNVLLIGQSGSGKSSIINTLLKVIIGEYIPRARAGFGDVPAYTLQLKCYKNCGAMDVDFERREEQRTQENHSVHGISDSMTLMQAVRDKLPDLFEAAGMPDRNDENTKEILRLLIGGHIHPNINMAELMRLQSDNGLGFLPQKYRTSRNDYKMSMLVFACSCTSPTPYALIKCVREVLQEVDPFTSLNKYETDVFLLITRYDKVRTDVSGDSSDDGFIPSHTINSPKDPEEDNEVNETKRTITLDTFKEVSRYDKVRTDVSGVSSDDGFIPSHTINSPKDPEEDNEVNETERTITFDTFKEVSRKLTEAFIQTGTATHSQLYWASLNDSIGYDDIYVDNKALRLLKVLTSPLHTVEAPPLNNPKDLLNTILVDLLFGLRRALAQNIQLHFSHLVLYLAAIVLLVAFLHCVLW